MEVYLLVLIHGMWGNPDHLAEAARIIRLKTEETEGEGELDVLVAETNRESATYDGIDWGGERIADEILDRVNVLEKEGTKKVTKFSLLGYSLGGLLARYVVGILHARSFFTHTTPVNFSTIATPHIGLPRLPTFWGWLSSNIGPRLLSRTGEQFYAVDKFRGERSLLEVMADPSGVFIKGLKEFRRLSVYANAVNDTTVPYLTASISSTDPFWSHETNGIKIELDPAHPPILKSYTLPECPPPIEPEPSMLSTAYWTTSEKKKGKQKRPFLPPFLQKKFPFNVVIYTLLPLLFPLAICFAILRISLDARASRARIRLLEMEGKGEGVGGGKRARLIMLLRELEKEVDDRVADIVDAPGYMTPASEVSESESTLAPTPSSSSPTSTKSSPLLPIPEPHTPQPTLTPLQLSLVHTLTHSLPHLQKHLAYISNVRNSHAVIVSRDMKRFGDVHVRGRGVLEHWAGGFEF